MKTLVKRKLLGLIGISLTGIALGLGAGVGVPEAVAEENCEWDFCSLYGYPGPNPFYVCEGDALYPKNCMLESSTECIQSDC